MKELLAFVWLLIAALHPGASHTGDVATLAPAIAAVVSHDPLPTGWTQHESAAVLVTMAWHESRFGAHLVGPARCDKKNDCSAYGIYQAEHRPDLANDAVAATRQEYYMLRVGVRDCPYAPLSPAIGGCFFAGTTRPNLVAQSQSNHRMWEARRILNSAEGNPEIE